MNHTQHLQAANDQGSVEIGKGVYLSSQLNMLAEQKSWDEEDGSKIVDFTRAPYWMTTDDGQSPIAIHDETDLAENQVDGL